MEKSKIAKKRPGAFMKKSLSFLLALVLIAGSVLSSGAIETSAAAKGEVKAVSVTNLPSDTLTLAKGKKFTLKTSVEKTGKISGAVTYSSSKTAVATVSSKGVIKALKNGKTTITIKSKANPKIKLSIKVTVGTPVESLSIKEKSKTLKTGKTTTLHAEVGSTKASNKKVIWTSSNTKVATVSKNGKVKAISAGSAKITATAADGSGKKATIKVNVYEPVEVALNQTAASMGAGETLQLEAVCSDEKATVKWSSSDTEIAKVDKNGLVTALASGTASVMATVNGKTASCKITVIPKIKTIEINSKNDISVILTEKNDKLKAEDFTMKMAVDLNFVVDMVIDSVETEDCITYKLHLNYNNNLKSGEAYKIAVEGYESFAFGYAGEGYEIVHAPSDCYFEVGEEYFRSFGGYGYEVEITNLPKGLEITKKYGATCIYGSFEEAVEVETTIKVTDQYGNTETSVIRFRPISAEKISVVENKTYTFYLEENDAGDMVADVYSDLIGPSGASGSYDFEFVGSDLGLTLISVGGTFRITGELSNPGEYSVKVKISDKTNPTITATSTVTFKVSDKTTLLTGKITDAKGNIVPGARVELDCKDSVDGSEYSYSTTADAEGIYKVRVPSDRYYTLDACLSYSRYSYITLDGQREYNVWVSGSDMSKDFSLPIYEVKLVDKDGKPFEYEVKRMSFSDRFTSETCAIYSGGKLYFNAGDYYGLTGQMSVYNEEEECYEYYDLEAIDNKVVIDETTEKIAVVATKHIIE